MRLIEVNKLIADGADIPDAWDRLLEAAVLNHASDIHLTYQADGMHISLRIDGQLIPQDHVESFDAAWRLTNHVKILGDLDVGDRRRPLNGRAMLSIAERPIDLRIAALPTYHGQDIVVRILDRTVSLLSMEQLGLTRRELNRLRGLIAYPAGLVVVTGPTGAGKTTTLYAMLNHLNDGTRKIVTIESPIEYDMKGINQTQVNPQLGTDYGVLLPAVLQQDPNVIMIGEVRDTATAATAVRAAATGHLVFVTTHAISAAAAIESLISLGVHPHFLGRSLRGVVAQNLVRKLCPDCTERLEETASMLPMDDIRHLLPEDQTPALSHGRGCPKCHQSGYHGRMGLFEILETNETISRLIEERRPSNTIHAAAVDAGMVTIQQSGKLAAFLGQTTFEELLRTVALDEKTET